MQYIVLDLEWNQAMSSRAAIFNKLPIRLRGEIIQIGAVKLTEDMLPGEEFKAHIKPVYFRRMHYKVKQLTGIDKERLSKSEKFETVMKRFLDWCGPDCTFLTWGHDDKGIMEQNLIIHDMDIDWMDNWINLQVIFNLQTEGDGNQKSLVKAMEHFGIEQTRVAHDALGDAYNTALVCSKLNLLEGLAKYENAGSLLANRVSQVKNPSADGTTPLEHTVSRVYNSKAELFSDKDLTNIICPDCGALLKNFRWVNQGDRRYMTMASCPKHGKFLLRLKLRHAEDDTWSATRLLYRADENMASYYKRRASHPRSRGRRKHINKKTGKS
ncbi:MAG TPA: exonuclease domain-containing protein [Clostridiales bacterium]|nr:exonuclease domain-containing protein [Clostridiales bacterium]